MRSNDAEDYFSSSTIDREPREPKKGKQQKFAAVAKAEKDTENFETENGPLGEVEYKVQVTISSDAGETVVKFGKYSCYPEQLLEHLEKQLQSQFFKNRLKAAVAVG